MNAMPSDPAEHHLLVRRTARYFTLGDPRSPSDVWVVCHGYGQLAAAFIEEFRGIAAPGRLIVAPEALNRFYLNPEAGRAGAAARVGATWMTREDRLAEIDDYVRYLDDLLNECLGGATGKVRTTALGFSQGVATVMRWLVQGSVRLDRAILWAGTLPPEVDPAGASHGRLATANLHLVAGTTDAMVTREAVDRQRMVLEQAGIPVRFLEFAGGHRMDRATLDAIAGA